MFAPVVGRKQSAAGRSILHHVIAKMPHQKIMPVILLLVALAIVPAGAQHGSTATSCTYGDRTYPNGTTTTFDCPLIQSACNGAAMAARWICRDGRWCDQAGNCYVTIAPGNPSLIEKKSGPRRLAPENR
jgi:hypothetical protein